MTLQTRLRQVRLKVTDERGKVAQEGLTQTPRPSGEACLNFSKSYKHHKSELFKFKTFTPKY